MWKALKHSYNKEPFRIRRQLTEGAQFVDTEAYEKADGTILRDLSAPDDGGWLQEPTLLEKLVAEKLEREADSVCAEGWNVAAIAGRSRGADKIAACWAEARKITQIVFEPDWARRAKAAHFKRNDQLPDAMQIGVVVFPGSCATDSLADTTKVHGIPLCDRRSRGAFASLL